MPDESLRSGVPPSTATSVTAEPIVVRSAGSADMLDFPSIERRIRSAWEYVGLCVLFATSPVILTIAYLLRTGRDFSNETLIGDAAVVLVGLGLVYLGYRKADRLRFRSGIFSIVIVLGCWLFSSFGALWCGSKPVDFTITVRDAETGKPIPFAAVSFSERNGQHVMSRAGPDGIAEMNYRCFTYGSSSLVCDQGFAEFHSITVRVTAIGHVDFESWLSEIAGHGCRLHELPPPPVQIRLTPKR